MKRTFTILTILALLLICFPALSEARFQLDWRYISALTDSPQSVAFTPLVNSVYDIVAFPNSGGSISEISLYRGSARVASASNSGILTSRLTANQEYRIVMTGSGVCEIELMRRANGRSILMAEEINNLSAAGIIAREGNARWYVLTGTGGQATVRVSPEESGIRLSALCYSGNRALIARSTPTIDDGCCIYFTAEEGEKYFIRVAAPSGGIGTYTMSVSYGRGEAPSDIQMLTNDIEMLIGAMRAPRVSVSPEGSNADIAWVSSDESVAYIDKSGVLTALSEGDATIAAYAYGGQSASFSVKVNSAVPEALIFSEKNIETRVGDKTRLALTVYPTAAKNATIAYSSSDESVLTVDESGEITALKEGSAIVSARYGRLAAVASVSVLPSPPRYRALFMGEQDYEDGVNTVRAGTQNTLNALKSLFDTAKYSTGVSCETTVSINHTSETAKAAIREAFEGAAENDISILYMTCHGYYRDGMSILQFTDGSEMAACDLEATLREIEGTIVILMDCCDSGGFISTIFDSEQFSESVISAFTGETAPFSGDKYKLLVSASLTQDSYRLGYSSSGGDTATVFARALCDGLGWDIGAHRRSALSADSDYSGSITLWEACLYASRRVRWYLSIADNNTGTYKQDVFAYPLGDGLILFER